MVKLFASKKLSTERERISGRWSRFEFVMAEKGEIPKRKLIVNEHSEFGVGFFPRFTGTPVVNRDN